MSSWESVYAAGEQLNRYPYAEVVSFVKRAGRVMDVSKACGLDIGCGSGVHAQLMASEGAQVVAFDGSPSAIEHAKALHGDARITYSVATLDRFEPGDQRFCLSVDRLSSTYAPVDVVAGFYARLRASLQPGARLFWQGFDPGNSGRALGRFEPSAGTWTGFSSGVFAEKDTIYFFDEDEVDHVFAGYRFLAKKLVKETDVLTGYCHSYWSLELGFEG